MVRPCQWRRHHSAYRNPRRKQLLPVWIKTRGVYDLALNNGNEQAQKYKYNGKEYDNHFGLNVYEMDLRQYDPAMGRWVVQDPVIHHDYSPYSAFDNNPVYWSDPSGADSQLYKDKNGNVVAGSFDGQDALNLFNQYLNSSSKKSEEEVQKMYEFTTSEENNGNGGDGKNQN